MAPIKFEENCKEKLEERMLQPSASAWSKLSNDLDSNDSKNKRGSILYLGFAASIAGVLFVINVFFNTSLNEVVAPVLVETDRVTPKIELKQHTNNDQLRQGDFVEVSKENKLKRDTAVDDILVKSKSGLTEKSSVSNIQNSGNTIITSVEEVAGNAVETTEFGRDAKAQEYEEKERIGLTFEDSKAMEVVNQIKTLQKENGTVTDVDIENLLKQAEKDILRTRLSGETLRTVDADALLQDIEDDLDKSFRDKVFEGLKSGFKTVKTAVAERDN